MSKVLVLLARLPSENGHGLDLMDRRLQPQWRLGFRRRKTGGQEHPGTPLTQIRNFCTPPPLCVTETDYARPVHFSRDGENDWTKGLAQLRLSVSHGADRPPLP